MKDNYTSFKSDFAVGDHIPASWVNGVAKVLNNLKGTKFSIIRNSNGYWRAVIGEGADNDIGSDNYSFQVVNATDEDGPKLKVILGKIYVNGVGVDYNIADYFGAGTDWTVTNSDFAVSDVLTQTRYVTIYSNFGTQLHQLIQYDTDRVDTSQDKYILLATVTYADGVITSIKQHHFGDVRHYV